MKINFEKSKSSVERKLARLAVDLALEMNLQTENLTITFQHHSIEYGVLGCARRWNDENGIAHYNIWLRVDSAADRYYRTRSLIHELIHIADYQDEDFCEAHRIMPNADIIHENIIARENYWINKLSN